eukprot:10411826-Alexandrium_andersonii.AAC.1
MGGVNRRRQGRSAAERSPSVKMLLSKNLARAHKGKADAASSARRLHRHVDAAARTAPNFSQTPYP